MSSMLWIALIALYCFVALAFCIALGVAARKPVPCLGFEAQQTEQEADVDLQAEQRSVPYARDGTDHSCLLHDKYAGLNGNASLGEASSLKSAPVENNESHQDLPARTSPVIFIQQSKA
jgi:hypothetical protein